MTDHQWPADGQCLWSQWFPHRAREGVKKPTQYRTCLHPNCNEAQYREAPVG